MLEHVHGTMRSQGAYLRPGFVSFMQGLLSPRDDGRGMGAGWERGFCDLPRCEALGNG